ncbi:MAG: DUF4317 domain-containing protein [Eubacteriales bacterium]|jgi:hypothetical protein
MNKKEVIEIRKTMKPDDTRIQRICGCYVDGHKEKIAEMREAFLSLPEEELHKYSELLRKTTSGKIGKNLLNLEFPLEEEADGGRQSMLLALRDSELKDDELLEQFYDKVIATYLDAENYIILLAFGSYDVPGHATDGTEMEDASEYVYNFIICAICPVVLSKPGLVYDAEKKGFRECIQDRMVQMPEVGFLFPAFNDRNTDIHSLLYYSKNAEILHEEITEDLLGVQIPMTAGTQKKAFDAIIEETFSDGCDFEVAKTVHENLNALLEGKKEEPEPTPLDKKECLKFVESCGADADQIAHFEKAYDEEAGEDGEMLASNIASTRKFTVESDDVKISVDSSRTDLIETRVIDGIEYLMIPVTDNVTVNGIRIRTTHD